MTTEAGKRLLNDEMNDRLLIAIGDPPAMMEQHFEAAIAAIEAEAFENGRLSVVQDGTKDAWVAAALAEAAEKVRGLETTFVMHTCWDDHEGPEGGHADGSKCNDRLVGESVSRAAVLAILEER